jgi:Leucine-rich repeat (LRR) protein
MRHLRLGNNNISSLEGLEGLHDLVVLELDHNQVSLGISLRQNSSGAVLRSL